MRCDGWGIPSTGENRIESLGKGCSVAGRDEATAGVAHDLRDSTDVGGDNRPAAGESFQDDVGAALHIAGEGDQIGGCHPNCNLIESTAWEQVNETARVFSGDRGLGERSIGAVADEVDMEIGAPGLERYRGLDELAQALSEVHAADEDDSLRGGMDSELRSGGVGIANVEDSGVGAADYCAGLCGRRSHGDHAIAQVAANGEEEVGFAQEGLCVLQRETVVDAVDVRSDTHCGAGDRECFCDGEAGISIGIEAVAEDEIGVEAFYVR